MKSIKIILLVTIFFGNINKLSSSNYYHDYIDMAERMFKNEHYKLSANYYDSAFLRYEGYKKHLFDAALCNSFLGNKEKTYSFLIKAIEMRFYDKQMITNNKSILKCLGKKRIDEIISKIEVEETNHNLGINDSLRDVLNHLFYIDQRLRKVVGIYEEKYSDNQHPEIRKLWDRIKFMDSIKVYDLINIIEKFGYPGISLVGEDGNHAARLILNHANYKIQEKYLPLLKESCEKGDSKWVDYAFIYDRIKTSKREKVKYGCSYYYDKGLNSYIHYAEDKNCMNYYREQVGLPPLEGYRSYENCSINK